MAKTHDEKDKLIKELKQEIRSLKSENGELKLKAANVEGQFAECTEPAISLLKDGDNFHIIKLKYDPKTGFGKVVETGPGTRDFSLVMGLGKKIMVEEIFYRYQLRR